MTYCNANIQTSSSQNSKLFYLICQQIFIANLLGIGKQAKCHRAEFILISCLSHFPISLALFLLLETLYNWWSYIQSDRIDLKFLVFSTYASSLLSFSL